MNKIYLLSSLLLIVGFSGCGPKTSAYNYFQKDPISANSIQYTKKRDLNYQNETKAMFFSTYLNNINEKYRSDKLNSFVVGVHLVNNDNNHELEKNGYEITLNDKKANNIVKLDTNSNLVKSIPLKNSWANYYLVHFTNEEDIKELALKFSHSKFGQVSVEYLK